MNSTPFTQNDIRFATSDPVKASETPAKVAHCTGNNKKSNDATQFAKLGS